jgi:hypothetical protein
MLFLFPWLSPLCWVLVVALIDFALFNISRHGFFLTRSSTKDVGYLSTRFEYFLNRFAQTLDQVRPKLDQDRARRALSDALLRLGESVQEILESGAKISYVLEHIHKLRSIDVVS